MCMKERPAMAFESEHAACLTLTSPRLGCRCLLHFNIWMLCAFIDGMRI